jgi:hypothetical protein
MTGLPEPSMALVITGLPEPSMAAFAPLEKAAEITTEMHTAWIVEFNEWLIS